MGPAYRGRDGRARGVKPDEVARWRADVGAHVDAMIASIPVQVARGIGALLVIIFFGGWLLDSTGIPKRFHGPATGLGIFVVGVGLFGPEAWDHVARWRRRRDGIEYAVRARAPLPIDPARLGSGRNRFQIASIAVAAPVILLAVFSHVDEGLIGRVDRWGWVLLVVPLAWGCISPENGMTPI